VATPEEYIFCGSIHSTIDAQLPQKVPKQKTCQTPRKWVISDYPLLNCITAKNVKFCIELQQKDLHHQKAYKNLHIRHLNMQFFISQIVFKLYAVKNAFLT
jgi:hypothetical protein